MHVRRGVGELYSGCRAHRPGVPLTEIDVGGVDERPEDDADRDGTDRQGGRLLLHALEGRQGHEEIPDLLIVVVELLL